MLIGICDDEKRWTDIIIEYCDRIKAELEVDLVYLTFMSGEEVLTHDGNIDLLLLDIEMQGINGIDAMRELEERDNIKSIVFISSHSECVFDSFSSKTKGFICKPVEYDRLKREIEKVYKQITRSIEDKCIEVIANNKKICISADSIIYVAADGRYVTIVTRNEKYLICENLKYWEDILGKYHIKRVHKSYLVNYDYIVELSGTGIKLKERNEVIPVGRKYYNICRQEYREYLFKKYRG